MDEVLRLQDQRNKSSSYYSATPPSEASKESSEKLNKLKVKCGKLEDALLSLEEENMKLNRYKLIYLDLFTYEIVWCQTGAVKFPSC